MIMIKKIMYEWKKISNSGLLIETLNNTFEIQVEKHSLPHLLGLHYMNSDTESLKGIRLFNKILRDNLTDEQIYSMVKENNPEQLSNVKRRVKYFQEFMYNLDKASVVEMTNPKTKIKSHHLILQSMDNKYLQLGIAKGEAIDYFETFLISADDFYFKESSIKERVTGIYKYDENYELVPFSFDPVKAGYLEYEYKKNKYNAEECVKDDINNTQIDTDNEDEWDIEI